MINVKRLLQGDEGFPGYPGLKVRSSCKGAFILLQRLAVIIIWCFVVFSYLFFYAQGAAGDSGTGGGPGPKGNSGQRVSLMLYDYIIIYTVHKRILYIHAMCN